MDTDVIICGAGPVGLLLAIDLCGHGVRTVVLERNHSIDQTIKALAVHGTAAEALDARGITGRLGEMPSLQEIFGDTPLESIPRGHFAGMWILYGGSHPDHLPLLAEQQQLEQALETRARELGATIRRGDALTDFSQDADGVTVTLGDGSTLRAGWLVGSDGGRSTVRKRTGIAFPGTDGIITGYQAATEYDDPDFIEYGWHRLPGGLLLRRSEPSSVLTVEFGRPSAEAPVTQEEVQAAVRRLTGTQVTLTECTSVTRFTDNARQAETYRSGRVLLAGDAAHVHSPFGGQGLNLGLGDAINLGWKLAAQVKGWAPDGLLDTYTAERHPVAARVLHNTRAQVALLRPGPHVDALRELFTDLTSFADSNTLLSDLMTDFSIQYGQQPDSSVGRYAEDFSTDGRHGLLVDPPDSLAELATAWSDRIRIITGKSGEPLLIRPDGFIAWAGEKGMEPALRTWFGPEGNRVELWQPA